MAPIDDPEIWRTMLENLPAGVCVLDPQKTIVLWSAGAERMTGHLRHEVIGHSCVAEPLVHCDQPGCEFCGEHCPAAQSMKTSQSVDTRGFLRHKDGHEVAVRIRAIPVRNRHGSVIGALETFDELQPGREASAVTPDSLDPATGVLNPAIMQAHLQVTLQSIVAFEAPRWILLLQVQRLAHFRASLGREPASSLLRVIARTVEGLLRGSDLIGRWSDDQFLLIVDGSREEPIHMFTERIRRMVAAEAIEWWGERRSLPVRIAAVIAQPGDTLPSVLQRLNAFPQGPSAGSHGSQRGTLPGS